MVPWWMIPVSWLALLGLATLIAMGIAVRQNAKTRKEQRKKAEESQPVTGLTVLKGLGDDPRNLN